MKEKRISDNEIMKLFEQNKSNNWIHTELKVGMDRIKKLRAIWSNVPLGDLYNPEDLPKDLPKDLPNNLPKDLPTDLPTDLPKDQYHDNVRVPNDFIFLLDRLSYNRHLSGKDRRTIRQMRDIMRGMLR